MISYDNNLYSTIKGFIPEWESDVKRGTRWCYRYQDGRLLVGLFVEITEFTKYKLG